VKELIPDDPHLHNWLDMARERIAFQGLPARICWVGLGRPPPRWPRLQRDGGSGELKAPVVIGRDHLDSGSVASPNRETEAMKDGSDAVSDWPLLNALLNTASGATWVSLHHGGGVGMGFSQHSGMVICRRRHRMAPRQRRLERCCGTIRPPASAPCRCRATTSRSIARASTAGFDYLCVGYAEEANTQALLKRARDWGVGLVRDHDLIADPLAAHDGVAALIARNDLIYLTIDIDVLSHFQAPGVSAPAARGVPLSTIEQIIALTLEKAGDRLALADLVELCPAYDQDGVTAKTAALLARRILMSA
jgi:hypothetical protein